MESSVHVHYCDWDTVQTEFGEWPCKLLETRLRDKLTSFHSNTHKTNSKVIWFVDDVGTLPIKKIRFKKTIQPIKISTLLNFYLYYLPMGTLFVNRVQNFLNLRECTYCQILLTILKASFNYKMIIIQSLLIF